MAEKPMEAETPVSCFVYFSHAYPSFAAYLLVPKTTPCLHHHIMLATPLS